VIRPFIQSLYSTLFFAFPSIPFSFLRSFGFEVRIQFGFRAGGMYIGNSIVSNHKTAQHNPTLERTSVPSPVLVLVLGLSRLWGFQRAG
jgi:hypothetical protein